MDNIQNQLNDIYEVAELELDFLMTDLIISFEKIEIKHDIIELYYIQKTSKKQLIKVIIKI